MVDSRKVGMSILPNVERSYGRPNPSGNRLGLVDSEDDLPPDVTGQPPLECLTRPSQRQDRVQHRPDPAGVDQPGDLDELVPARLHDEVDPAGPGVPGRLRRGSTGRAPSRVGPGPAPTRR